MAAATMVATNIGIGIATTMMTTDIIAGDPTAGPPMLIATDAFVRAATPYRTASANHIVATEIHLESRPPKLAASLILPRPQHDVPNAPVTSLEILFGFAYIAAMSKGWIKTKNPKATAATRIIEGSF
jgi:hypothetical protein